MSLSAIATHTHTQQACNTWWWQKKFAFGGFHFSFHSRFRQTGQHCPGEVARISFCPQSCTGQRWTEQDTAPPWHWHRVHSSTIHFCPGCRTTSQMQKTNHAEPGAKKTPNKTRRGKLRCKLQEKWECIIQTGQQIKKIDYDQRHPRKSSRQKRWWNNARYKRESSWNWPGLPTSGSTNPWPLHGLTRKEITDDRRKRWRKKGKWPTCSVLPW